MAERPLTEDAVRDMARDILGLQDASGVRAGVGQLTTFNQLGFSGVADKPDGWYLPDNRHKPALILEAKAAGVSLGAKQADEVLKNVRIAATRYDKVIGILYNGSELRVFKNGEEVNVADSLQQVDYYLSLFDSDAIDKNRIYELTAHINNCLHFEMGIKNLYHRMIFTACALVAECFGANLGGLKGRGYQMFHAQVAASLTHSLEKDRARNSKLGLLVEVFGEIKMNTTSNQKAIDNFIDWVCEIAACLDSQAWRGEDVMGIFFNEFNRYKKKSEAGQVFTPEHITDFMYRILEVGKDDRVLDATCGSGGFLVKAMSNMIQQAGGVKTGKADEIRNEQLYGIEFDREVYALACANMLIHGDGKTNLVQLDARSKEASRWITWEHMPEPDSDDALRAQGLGRGITKVLMNPPYENKYGCMDIVENVLDSVPAHTSCGFILPDKKLEKVSKKQVRRILKHHRLTKIIKLPEDVFFGIGITTSIFVFEAHVAQDGHEIFTCYMEQDGLVTVKNKGRHDVRGAWPAIEEYWVDSILKLRDERYGTARWIDPDEHLSYQMPAKPFEITEQDFRKVAMDYLLFQQGADAREFKDGVLSGVLYASDADVDGKSVRVGITEGLVGDGND